MVYLDLFRADYFNYRFDYFSAEMIIRLGYQISENSEIWFSQVPKSWDEVLKFNHKANLFYWYKAIYEEAEGAIFFFDK